MTQFNEILEFPGGGGGGGRAGMGQGRRDNDVRREMLRMGRQMGGAAGGLVRSAVRQLANGRGMRGANARVGNGRTMGGQIVRSVRQQAIQRVNESRAASGSRQLRGPRPASRPAQARRAANVRRGRFTLGN